MNKRPQAAALLLLVGVGCATSLVREENQPDIKRTDDTLASKYQLDVYPNTTVAVSGASTSTTTTTLSPDWV